MILNKLVLFFMVILGASMSFGQAYNISDDFINVSHERSQYFTPNSNAPLRFDDFLKKADKSKPIFIHSHGCAGVENDTFALKDFYVSLGASFVILDFIKRGDASPCNHLGVNNLNYKDDSQKYIADLKYRIPARVKELEHHIKLMRINGFNIIFAIGHSEGGMVVQRLNEKVDGVIIHSMTCFPTTIDTSFNRYLHLVSINDPLLTKTSGRKFGCTDKSNFTVVQSEVKSHVALADASWKDQIRNFVKDNSNPK